MIMSKDNFLTAQEYVDLLNKVMVDTMTFFDSQMLSIKNKFPKNEYNYFLSCITPIIGMNFCSNFTETPVKENMILKHKLDNVYKEYFEYVLKKYK